MKRMIFLLLTTTLVLSTGFMTLRNQVLGETQETLPFFMDNELKTKFERETVIQYVKDKGNKDIKIENGKTVIKYYEYKNNPEKSIVKALKQEIKNKNGFNNEFYHDFYPEEIRSDGKYFYSVVSSFPKKQKTEEMIYPTLLVAIGKFEGKNWKIAFETKAKDYNKLLEEVPTNLVSKEEKENLYIPIETTSIIGKIVNQVKAATTYSIPGLPWKPETSWVMTQGIHSSNDCCLDFDTTTQDETVYAAEDGTNVYKNGTCVYYKNGTKTLIYQHLDVSSAPSSIDYGEDIGDLSTSAGCGWPYSVAKHIHFGIWNSTHLDGVAILGSTLNGWKVNYNSPNEKTYLTKGDSTVYVNGSVSHSGTASNDDCTPPVSGTWTIGEVCNISSTQSVNGNIHITDSGELNLQSGGYLSIDLSTYKIELDPSGKITINPNAKISN